MMEPSEDINRKRYFLRMVCQFQNGAQQFCTIINKLKMIKSVKLSEVEKMKFFGKPHFLSMAEPSKDINYNTSVNGIFCQFQNGVKHFCESTNEVTTTKNVKSRRTKK